MRSAILRASAGDLAMPLSAWRSSSLARRRAKRSRSSARSMASGRRAENRDAGRLERLGELEGRLPAELHDHAGERSLRLLGGDDLEHVLDGKRLEIETVGGVVVGRHRLGIAIDHDGFVAGLVQREASMAAAIVEFDALADPVGSAAEDDHLPRLARPRLVPVVVGDPRLVGRVHVRRRRGEFRRAGVDALVDGPHLQPVPRLPHLVFAGAGELGKARVGEAHGLERVQGLAALRQARRTDLLLHRDDVGDLRDEPRVEAAAGMNAVDGRAEPQRLGDREDAIGRWPAETGPDGVLVVSFAEPRDLDLIEAGEPGLEAAQRLLQRLGEGAPDGHDLADRFHGRRQDGLGPRELLEGEARDLRHHVVDGGLEGSRRRTAGDVVGELVERVADRELRRDLGDREAGCLRRERRRPRHPRVHLDDHQPAVRRIDGELHVRTAGLDADLAQHRDRCVAHDLVLLVGQRQGRRHGDRIPRVDAHRIDVLDRADDDAVVVAVAHHLHLVFLPAEHRLLDQNLVRWRGIEAALDDLQIFLAVVGDAAAGAAEREGGADDGRQSDRLERGERSDQVVGQHRARRVEADLAHRLAELLAVLRLVDDRCLGADHFDAERLEHAHLVEGEGGVERRLPAHRGKEGVRPLLLDDAGDDLRRDRLDIGGVGEVRIGHDRRRIGIDEDDPVALGLQRPHRLRARVVELAGLADDDRPSPDDQDGLDVCPLRHVEREPGKRAGFPTRPACRSPRIKRTLNGGIDSRYSAAQLIEVNAASPASMS